MTSPAIAQIEKLIALQKKAVIPTGYATAIQHATLYYSNSLFGRLYKSVDRGLSSLIGRLSTESETTQKMEDLAKIERLQKLIDKYRNWSAHKAVAHVGWVHRSNSQIGAQVLRAEFDSDWNKINDYYGEVLELLVDDLDYRGDIEWIRAEFSLHYEEVKNCFSSIRGKIRSLSKALSVSINSIDKRKIFRTKITNFIRRADDEDLIK